MAAALPSPRRVTLAVASGTGNTHRAATWLAEVAQRAGAEATVCPLPGVEPAALRQDVQGDLFVVCFPTHGFTAPWHLLRFAWRLPRRPGHLAAVLATRAGMVVGPWQPPGLAGTGPFVVALLLWLKGFHVLGARSVNMPSNWMSLHWGLRADTVARIHAVSRPQVERFAEALLGGQRVWWTVNLAAELVLGLALAPLSLGYLLVGRVFLGKLFFATSACNGCGQCAMACPVGAIELQGDPARPFWRHSCESCMRCMGYCPRKAIEAGHSWGGLAAGLSVVAVAALFRLFGVTEAQHPALAGGWGYFTVLSLVSLPVTLAAYRLFSRALRLRSVNAFFTFTTLTHWYRRFHDPGTTLKALAPSMRPLPGRGKEG